nr:MAG TPA: hypothetical protein [Caudoviricetes sp.]
MLNLQILNPIVFLSLIYNYQTLKNKNLLQCELMYY